MTKSDLISEVAKRTGLSQASVRESIETFLQVVKESILGGMSVQIRGFGSFFRKQRASKKARNLSTNTSIIIPAHDVPAYKPSKEFAQAVRER